MGETIHVRGEGGTVFAMDLPLPEGVAQRLARGDIVRVEAGGSPHAEPAEDPGPEDADPFAVKRPAPSAPKAEWVVYAVSQGASVLDAEGFTKTELIEKFGGQ